jgi:hypothetical protein
LAAPGGGGSIRSPTAPQAWVPRRQRRRWWRRRHLEAAPAFPHRSRGSGWEEEPSIPPLTDWPKRQGATAQLRRLAGVRDLPAPQSYTVIGPKGIDGPRTAYRVGRRGPWPHWCSTLVGSGRTDRPWAIDKAEWGGTQLTLIGLNRIDGTPTALEDGGGWDPLSADWRRLLDNCQNTTQAVLHAMPLSGSRTYIEMGVAASRQRVGLGSA